MTIFAELTDCNYFRQTAELDGKEVYIYIEQEPGSAGRSKSLGLGLKFNPKKLRYYVNQKLMLLS
jgi:phage terminase large subunit-like protein